MKVHVLIGVPGSGKTTWAKAKVLEDGNVFHFSSDQYRAGFKKEFPDIEINELNSMVFDHMQKQLFEKMNHGDKYEYVYDATNINRRRRRFLYGEIKRRFPDAQVISHVFFETLSYLIGVNTRRSDDEKVPYHVIRNYYFNLQVPRIGADCDDIVAEGTSFFHRSKEALISIEGLKEAIVYNKDLKFRTHSLINEIWDILDNQLEHDCKPHHMETVHEHIQMCIDNSDTDQLKQISLFHDLGKEVTKAYDKYYYARYLGHANVSAYYYLNYALTQKSSLSESEWQDMLQGVEVVYQHMNAHKGIGDKNKRNNKLSGDDVALIQEFAAIDSKSRTTLDDVMRGLG